MNNSRATPESYKVFAALYSESLEGWIWTSNKTLQQNAFIIVTNVNTGKKIRCFHRVVDENFIRKYNRERTINIASKDSVVVMNSFYRDLLGVSTGNRVMLSITRAHSITGLIWANWSHPNPLIQLNQRLSAVALIFAVLSLIFGLLSMRPIVRCLITPGKDIPPSNCTRPSHLDAMDTVPVCREE